jgi:Sec7-like guanine-nucleotide exchange factor
VCRLDLKGLAFLPALRRMIAQFRLPGEGQVIDRVMRNFCDVYCDENGDAFKAADNAHTLAMLVLTLNTATHNPNEERKIALDDWIIYCADLVRAHVCARMPHTLGTARRRPSRWRRRRC